MNEGIKDFSIRISMQRDKRESYINKKRVFNPLNTLFYN